MAVEVLGFNGVPAAGLEFLVVASESKAREIAESRKDRKRDQIAKSRIKTSMESIMSQIAAGDIKEFDFSATPAVTIGSQGASPTGANLPPYLGIRFIIKT